MPVTHDLARGPAAGGLLAGVSRAVEKTGTVAVVIPCYKVTRHIQSVIERIGPEVDRIYVVDDKCPENSGRFVEDNVADGRVKVVYHKQNMGVGGATITGMIEAAADGADVIVKIDGDGQMDPAHIPNFVSVILSGEADYTKGNRFFELDGLAQMPPGRLIGNAGLSFMAKFSTGYWDIFDPTNGYFAIHADIVGILPMEKIAKRYFFESDMLFRLNIAGAVVMDIPMHSHYADEVSGMSPFREIPKFTALHTRNFFKRILYSHFLRGFSIASIELVLGIAMCLFGTIFGIVNWRSDVVATAGTVMLASLPIIIGVQLIIAFLNYDIQSVPRAPLQSRLSKSLRTFRALRHQAAAGN